MYCATVNKSHPAYFLVSWKTICAGHLKKVQDTKIEYTQLLLTDYPTIILAQFFGTRDFV